MSEGVTRNQLSPLPSAASVDPGPAEAKSTRGGGERPLVSAITALGLAMICPENGGASLTVEESTNCRRLGAPASRSVSDPSPRLKTSHVVLMIEVWSNVAPEKAAPDAMHGETMIAGTRPPKALKPKFSAATSC